MKTQRALNRVPKYLCDIAVKIVTAAGLQPLLAAIAGISAMKNQMHVVKAVCALEEPQLLLKAMFTVSTMCPQGRSDTVLSERRLQTTWSSSSGTSESTARTTCILRRCRKTGSCCEM